MAEENKEHIVMAEGNKEHIVMAEEKQRAYRHDRRKTKNISSWQKKYKDNIVIAEEKQRTLSS